MLPLTHLQGQRVCIVGAARSGLAAARALADLGALPFLTDAAPDPSAELRASGFSYETGAHTRRALRNARLVVVSPGVPWHDPFLEAARQRELPVIGEVELAWLMTKAPILAITGSNGKSTTTALAAHLLRSAGLDAVACGNIGVPLCDLALSAPPTRILVAELSSFQLEGTSSFRPRVAAVLNLSPDHLERHGGFSGYVQAKKRIFANSGQGDWVVLGDDDRLTRTLAAAVPPAAKIQFFGKSIPAPVSLDGWRIPGPHNRANALAALAIVHSFSPALDHDSLERGLADFRPLPHRQEEITTIDGVVYVNDSKATNVDSARMALCSYEGGVIWIAGGKDKGSDLQPLVEAARGRVRRVLLIGEAAERFAAALADHAESETVGTLAHAIERARALAQPGDTVLLSPACASYDQFRDFEARGEAMRTLLGPAEEVG
jgi:UDP-N-acetylmuramoylalanine--D-glutamate ligase